MKCQHVSTFYSSNERFTPQIHLLDLFAFRATRDLLSVWLSVSHFDGHLTLGHSI